MKAESNQEGSEHSAQPDDVPNQTNNDEESKNNSSKDNGAGDDSSSQNQNNNPEYNSMYDNYSARNSNQYSTNVTYQQPVYAVAAYTAAQYYPTEAGVSMAAGYLSQGATQQQIRDSAIAS